MTIYVAEIEGKAIAAFSASTLSKAAEMIENPHLLREDFIERGLCVEDAEISLRPALPEEIAKWSRSHGRNIMRGDFGPCNGDDEMTGIAFLDEVSGLPYDIEN